MEPKSEPDIEEVITELKGKGRRKKQDEPDGEVEDDRVYEEDDMEDEEMRLEDGDDEEEEGNEQAGPSKRQKIKVLDNEGDEDVDADIIPETSDSDEAFEFADEEDGNSPLIAPHGKTMKASNGKRKVVAEKKEGREGGRKGKK